MDTSRASSSSATISVPSSTTSSASTITPEPNTGQPSGLSTGAKVGIGVGAGLGAIILLGLAFWLGSKRHSLRTSHKKGSVGDIDNGAEQPRELPGDESATVKPKELAGDDKSATVKPIEKDGMWRGGVEERKNAPASSTMINTPAELSNMNEAKALPTTSERHELHANIRHVGDLASDYLPELPAGNGRY